MGAYEIEEATDELREMACDVYVSEGRFIRQLNGLIAWVDARMKEDPDAKGLPEVSKILGELKDAFYQRKKEFDTGMRADTEALQRALKALSEQ